VIRNGKKRTKKIAVYEITLSVVFVFDCFGFK